MLDDLDRLRNKPQLLELLTHYARLVQEDRQTWQDRLMHMEGVGPADLAKLHGELIAFGWVEQNSGQVPIIRAGAVPSCYRITLHGQRALQQVQGLDIDVEAEPEAPARTSPRFSRKRREHAEADTLVAAE